MVNNKKIIVLGGSGLIGNSVVDLCLKNGAEVLSVDLKSPIKKFKDVNYF